MTTKDSERIFIDDATAALKNLKLNNGKSPLGVGEPSKFTKELASNDLILIVFPNLNDIKKEPDMQNHWYAEITVGGYRFLNEHE